MLSVAALPAVAAGCLLSAVAEVAAAAAAGHTPNSVRAALLVSAAPHCSEQPVPQTPAVAAATAPAAVFGATPTPHPWGSDTKAGQC